MDKTESKKIVVAVSGYFNPLHTGHLKLFKDAKKLGDYLVVIINNDSQVIVKGRVLFMPENDRAEIVSAIKWVDKAFISIDKDISVCKSLKEINPDIFANGGDRHESNLPEAALCKELNIKMVDNVGGDKLNSSSALIKKASESRVKSFK
ncbi:adenylyltransferase/cytidyltransferase family protein [Candidatus Parcubacteria bacterium]|nr:adenylyltransferase/cytidyltransferase family protein [Candidatus Parcubacteria bacterium]